MIYESLVVEKVCEYLIALGWTISSSCGPTEKGDDIVAIRDGQELRIEAKGAGSERPTSARHGQPFTRNQVKSHVAVAFYRAARMRTDEVAVGMAFPDNEHHREMVSTIADSVQHLGITVFWVSDSGAVSESS